jgi:hypothetical protein
MELEIFVTGKGIQMFGHNPRGEVFMDSFLVSHRLSFRQVCPRNRIPFINVGTLGRNLSLISVLELVNSLESAG